MVFKKGLLTDVQSSNSEDGIDLMSAVAKCAEDVTMGKPWSNNIQELLENIGKSIKVSRVWIFQVMSISETEIMQDYIFEWASKPQYTQITHSRFSMFTREIIHDEYRNLIESRKRGEWQNVSVKRLQPGFLKNDQLAQGIESMLTVPIMVDGQWWGTLGLDDCERDCEWTEMEISLLRICAALIATAVLNNKIGAYREQFNVLQNISEHNIWTVDLTTWHVQFISNNMASPNSSDGYYDQPLRSILKNIHIEDRRKLIKKVRTLFLGRAKTIRQDVRIQTKEDTLKWIELIGNINTDKRGRPTQFSGIAIDILDRKTEEEKLRIEALHDQLTGILNRRGLNVTFEKLKGSVLILNAFSVIILDIDFFKTVNDRWGHDTGDAVLTQVTDVVKSQLRTVDIFARYGGEEFIILLPDVDNKLAISIGNRIRVAIEETPFNTGREKLSITVSLGCTTKSGDMAVSLDELITTADRALYDAKRTGRNRLCSCDLFLD